MAESGMSALTLRECFLLDITCALLTHLVYHKYEIEPSSVLTTFVLLVGVPYLPAWFFASHYRAWAAIPLAFIVYHVALISSIVAYRVSPLHPLAKYPGPFFAKVTKLWNIKNAASGKQHVIYKKLHEQYGRYVRVGPNELSILDVDAIQPLLGSDGLPKGPIWDARRNPDGVAPIIGIRNWPEHAHRRRMWNNALSAPSVKGYQPIVEKRALQLMEELEKRNKAKEEIDFVQWMNYFTFDFMGDLVFGGGFELMAEGDTEGIRRTLEEGIKPVALIQNIPWIMRLLFRNPKTIANVIKFRNFAIRQIERRQAKEEKTRDLFHYLADEEGNESEPLDFNQMVSDSVVAIVAGSDTTSTTLSAIFYFLLSHPDAYLRLQKEVDSVFPPGELDPFDVVKLAEMQWLNAVINETMRLSPPLCTGVQRGSALGSAGRYVCGHYIPGGTAVAVPPYPLHRDPKYFSPFPEDFWPDRWILPSNSKDASTIASPIVTNQAAFIPFSTGPANCAGKGLALLEMRIVVALIMQRFEVRFAEGYDPKSWDEDYKDFFIAKPGKLLVALSPRHH